MRDLTKVIFSSGGFVVVDLDFVAFGQMLADAEKKQLSFMQVATAGGEPALLRLDRIDYVQPAEA